MKKRIFRLFEGVFFSILITFLAGVSAYAYPDQDSHLYLRLRNNTIEFRHDSGLADPLEYGVLFNAAGEIRIIDANNNRRPFEIESGITIAYVDPKVVIAKNEGVIKANDGTVKENLGTIETNSGTVETNSGTVGTNSGTVETNNGTIVANGGTVGENNGTIVRDLNNDSEVDEKAASEEAFVKKIESMNDELEVLSQAVTSGTLKGTQTMEYTEGAVPISMLLTLERCPNVAVKYNTVYEGQEYCFTIQGGKKCPLDPSYAYHGPLGFLQYYPNEAKKK